MTVATDIIQGTIVKTGTSAERTALSLTLFERNTEFWENTGNRFRWTGTAWVQTHASGAAHVTDSIALSGNAQGSISISGTAAQSSALTGGIYDVGSTVDCYVKVNATANNVTTSTGYLLRANNTIPLIVPDQEKIGAITSGATGTLTYHRVN